MLIKSLFLFFITFSLVAESSDTFDEICASTPIQIATLYSQNESLIGGLISPLSGQLALRKTDLVALSNASIALSRVYIPIHLPTEWPQHTDNRESLHKMDRCSYLSRYYKGWQYFPHAKLFYSKRNGEFLVTDPNGATLSFRIKGDEVVLDSFIPGVSNIANDEPNGMHDPRNTRISFDKNQGELSVFAPDGAVRLYRFTGANNANGSLLSLIKEILPNGKILRYHSMKNGFVFRVESLDPQERFIYSTIDIEQKGNDIHFQTSLGGKTSYHYQRKVDQAIVHKETKHLIGTDVFHTEYTLYFPPQLSSIYKPCFYDESFHYSNDLYLTEMSSNKQIFKVEQNTNIHKLLFPVGENDAFIPVYEMDYQERKTVSKKSDGTSIVYHFSIELLPTKTEWFDEEGKLQKQKIYTWNEKQQLQSLAIYNSSTLVRKKEYAYDRFGNPTLELFTADLTGSGELITKTIHREFSDDGKHLLLKEEHEGELTYLFSYLPKTNLIASKIVKDQEQVFSEEHFTYDDANNLIQITKKEGDYRFDTLYTLYQSGAHLHRPEWIEESYTEAGTKKLLKKQHLIYDSLGYLAKEEIFDSNDQHAYTIERSYNEAGFLLSETNSLGQKASYLYDLKGQKIRESSFSNRRETNFSYDTKGRLILKTEKGDEGICHTKTYSYDPQDRLIEKTDPYQNRWYYEYKKLLKKEACPSLSIEKRAIFDPFGKLVEQQNANGHTTTYRYNDYGSIADIQTTDNVEESYRYSPWGYLIQHTDKKGLISYYENDSLGRPLKKSYFSKEGTFVGEEKFTYDAKKLIEHTDIEGRSTHYTYDGCARLIKEECLDRGVEYRYDSFGFLSLMIKENGPNTLYIHYERDLMGRPIVETKTDQEGHVLHRIYTTYNSDGHIETIQRFINQEMSVEAFTYDSFGRVIERKDPLGFSYHTSYQEGNHLVKTMVDPNQKITVTTYNCFGHLLRKELFDEGGLLSKEEYSYDPVGNLVEVEVSLIEDRQVTSTQKTRYIYSECNQILSETLASNTELEKTTTYTYTSGNLLATKTLPSKITLSYSYDELGSLTHLQSSDGKISHYFEQNGRCEILSLTDEVEGISVFRTLDPFGNILQEIFPSNIVLQKEWDAFNRLTMLQLPDQSSIHYSYDPLYLRKVSRYSPKNQLLYEHTYDQYDESGYLEQESLLGNLGTISHKTNPFGDKAGTLSSYFNEKITYDRVGNVLTSSINKNIASYSYDPLGQLTSEDYENRFFEYTYDSLYNRTSKNKTPLSLNLLNQPTDLLFSEEGNQLENGEVKYTYDPLNRLIEASSKTFKVHFSYDPLGRCLSKTLVKQGFFGWKEDHKEDYLYHQANEFGAMSQGRLKNCKVVGLQDRPIAIEVEGKTYAPLIDRQKNILALLDPNKKGLNSYRYTAFGEELHSNRNLSPWGFACKRFDPNLNLIHFGARFYDPIAGRWLSPDPEGPANAYNLYQYVYNNPLLYQDPDGRFAFVIPIVIYGAEAITLAAIATPIVYSAAIGVLAYIGAKTVIMLNDKLKEKGEEDAAEEGSTEDVPKEKKKKMPTWFPERPLPKDKYGVHIPDVKGPHTQLGWRYDAKGNKKYPQAREFDENGKPVRDIDFTDHDRPNEHPYPHQHIWEENPTGGTRKRGEKALPLDGWNYS